MPAANRRKFTRVHFHADARLYLTDGEHPVELVDLSLKGALVRPAETLYAAMGSQGALRLRLDGAGATIRMDVTLVHREGPYLGLACREIDLDSITHLRRLVELNIGDESVLDRELHALSRAE